jgi:hypothetical protein
MHRFRFTLRWAFIATFVFAVLVAFSVQRIQQLQQIGSDVESIRASRANVSLARGDAAPFSWFATGFDGHPTLVYKYFDTPDLKDADAFIDIVSRNRTITSLTVDGSPLTDPQAQRLLGLPLNALMISQCSIGDTLNATASNTLEFLSFARTRLDDRSLSALGRMPNVKRLDLTRTRVSDNSIDYLAELKSLSTLTILRCKISANGKQRLETLRPDVTIEWEPL